MHKKKKEKRNHQHDSFKKGKITKKNPFKVPRSVPSSAFQPGAASRGSGFSIGQATPTRHHPAGELSSALMMKTAGRHGEPRLAAPEPLAPIPATQRRRNQNIPSVLSGLSRPSGTCDPEDGGGRSPRPKSLSHHKTGGAEPPGDSARRRSCLICGGAVQPRQPGIITRRRR